MPSPGNRVPPNANAPLYKRRRRRMLRRRRRNPLGDPQHPTSGTDGRRYS